MIANVRAVWGGNEYLVVGDGPDGVLATRVDARGVVLDDPPLLIDRGEARDIAFDGTNFLVVYLDDSGERGYGSSLYGRRLSTAGGKLQPLDPSPVLISRADFVLSSWIYDASVSFGDGYYLVAWSRGYADTYDVATVRLTSAGVVAGQPVSMASPSDNEWSPRVAFDGRNFLVVWSALGIEGSFINPLTGVPGEPIGISQPLTEAQVFDTLGPQVAWNGANYLIAWSMGRLPGPLQVAGTRMSSDGEVIDGYPEAGGGFRLPPSAEFDSMNVLSSISWDGRDFILGWQEGYGPCSFDPCPPPRYRLLFSRVDSAGRPRGGVPNELGHGFFHSHSSGPAGETLFLYTSDERNWLRIITNQPRARPVRR